MQLVNVPEVGVPNIGVTSVGDVANTLAPVPVSSVKADAKLADVGVAKNVATPVPNPLTPVDIGSPVALVSVAEAGVPNAIALPLASVYNPFPAGYVTNTFFVPALKFTALPPLEDANMVSRDKTVPINV